MGPHRARAALAGLPWAPRARSPRAGPRAIPPAHPAPFLRAVSFALLALALAGVLFWSAPAEAQTATVLVKNTDANRQPVHYGLSLGANFKRAQAFTTGANPAGYTLSSIGFSFDSITMHLDSRRQPGYDAERGQQRQSGRCRCAR